MNKYEIVLELLGQKFDEGIWNFIQKSRTRQKELRAKQIQIIKQELPTIAKHRLPSFRRLLIFKNLPEGVLMTSKNIPPALMIDAQNEFDKFVNSIVKEFGLKSKKSDVQDDLIDIYYTSDNAIKLFFMFGDQIEIVYQILK